MTRKTTAITLAALLMLSVVAFAAPVTAATTTTVSLQPDSDNTRVSETATYNITVDSIDNGVSAYSFTVSIDDVSVGEITDVTLVGPSGTDGTFTDITYAEDNSSVTAYTTSSGDVLSDGTIATVTVTGVNPGKANMSVEVNQLADNDGNDYTVKNTNSADITVSEPEAQFTVANLSAPNEITSGSNVTVTANITNTGTANGTQAVSFQVADSVQATTSLPLNVGQSKSVTFEMNTTELELQEFKYGVYTNDSSKTGTATVVENPAQKYDADNDNTIETEEVQSAIKDWSSNKDLSTEELMRIIEMWTTGEPVDSS